MTPFAAEIKRLRNEAKLSQAALAEKLGVTQGYVAHLESGRNTGTTETLFALSDALGVPVDHWRPFLAEATEAPAAKPAKKSRKSKE